MAKEKTLTKKKLVYTVGLPASGTSTWAKEFIKDKKDWARVNNDELRLMMRNTAFELGDGALFDDVRRGIIRTLIAKNYNIIVDNTNLSPKHAEYYRKLVEDHNAEIANKTKEGCLYEVSSKDFTNVPLAECIARNKARPAPIPDKAIYAMYNQFLKKESQNVVQDPTLPEAIIVDMDGTMANCDGRSPFDLKKVYNDKPNDPIVTLVRAMKMAGRKIIFVTGRYQEAYDDTVRWLKDKVGLPEGEYLLYCRPDKDDRPDTQFKVELFNDVIKKEYYVEFWIEDRARMVQAVREIGITCLQCADGLF